MSKYATGLQQEPSTGRTIPSDPSEWACAETGVKENLWLNLSTGTIGSGRQASMQMHDPFFGMSGSKQCLSKALTWLLQALQSVVCQGLDYYALLVLLQFTDARVWSTCLQNWDGSGGNGAALRHFEATGSKYPLVVKLGTITPHGADVFSYAPDENDMVEDPKLVSSQFPMSGSFCTSNHVTCQWLKYMYTVLYQQALVFLL